MNYRKKNHLSDPTKPDFSRKEVRRRERGDRTVIGYGLGKKAERVSAYSEKSERIERDLRGSTPLSRRLLESSRDEHFASFKQKAEWEELEKGGVGTDQNSILWKAWLEHCIEWVEKKNRVAVSLPFSAAIAYAKNPVRFKEWSLRNTEKVLKTPAATEEALARRAKLDDAYSDD